MIENDQSPCELRIVSYADKLRNLEQRGHLESYPVSRIASYRHRLKGILASLGSQCVYCGITRNLTIDHYIPKSRHGTNHPSNLVPACADCNNTKADMLPLNFVLYRIEKGK